MALSIATTNVCSINGTIRSERRTSLIETRRIYQDKIAAVTFSHQQCQKMLPVAPVGAKASRRATGKTKKKSVKSRAILGSNRKLSRFGKEQKKGTKDFYTLYFKIASDQQFAVIIE